jgi:hypothetical protein
MINNCGLNQEFYKKENLGISEDFQVLEELVIC